MKPLIISTLLFLSLHSPAQVYRERIGFDLESIANISIGWMQIRTHAAAPKAKQLSGRSYSALQIGYCEQFVEWMQQSYLPKGCLGDATYYQNAIPKFSPTNSLRGNHVNAHIQALPLMYGAQTKVYMFLKKDAQGKFVPQNTLADHWNIEANSLQSITTPVSFISNPNEYYFQFSEAIDAASKYSEADKNASELSGFQQHKNIAAYQHLFSRLTGTGQYVVIMTKDNGALPFEKITIGEFLLQSEKQFPAWQKIVNLIPEKYALAQSNLAGLKEKYKTQLNDIAFLLPSSQIDLYSFVNATENNRDMFACSGEGSGLPVLKLNKEAKAACNLDQPQWLVVRWALGLHNESYYLHLHESILNNFNFEYAYNFFFKPASVKGQMYKPLRAASYNEQPLIKEASPTARNITADKSVVLFEDFSTTAANAKPVGWKVKLTNGTTATVTSREGLEGNWVMLRGHSLYIEKLPKGIPQNFTLTYDLVAAQGFTWGAKGLTMLLSNESSPGNASSFVKLKLRPGADGNNGEAMLETKFPSPAGYSNETKWYPASGFSNDKKNNRVKVTVKKSGEQLIVLLDNNKIAAYEKAIPAAHVFNALSFDCAGNSAANDTYYISNIKISKD